MCVECAHAAVVGVPFLVLAATYCDKFRNWFARWF
jgi:hypothetical protein